KRQREHNPPEVLRGNPEYTTELIDSLDFKYKYTSGVLSFAPGETITPEMEEAIMDRFEDTAFAGLSRDQYSIMWVRHSHAGHHELHFITPRVELSTGKSCLLYTS
ncbi:relaxase/mobilization nuclease domain-containing protein, partial [Enterobacter kobei]